MMNKQVKYYVDLDSIVSELENIQTKYNSAWHWGASSYETIHSNFLNMTPRTMEYNAFVKYLNSFKTSKMAGPANKAIGYIHEFAKKNKAKIND